MYKPEEANFIYSIDILSDSLNKEKYVLHTFQQILIVSFLGIKLQVK